VGAGAGPGAAKVPGISMGGVGLSEQQQARSPAVGSVSSLPGSGFAGAAEDLVCSRGFGLVSGWKCAQRKAAGAAVAAGSVVSHW
jgi:hypothetical protein